MADTTGDGRADIVGFGNDGVWVARAEPDGSFGAQAGLVVAGFGYAAAAGGWRVERHPRLMADTTGNGRADIVGFGNDGVWLSRANPNGSFTAPHFLFANFGYNAGWRVERHPRLIADNTHLALSASSAPASGLPATGRGRTDVDPVRGVSDVLAPRLRADRAGDGQLDVVKT